MKSVYQWLPWILVLVVFYVILFIPDSRRRKKFRGMIESLRVNDKIVTRGGIIGKIINMQDDSIILQTGPDKVKIKINKNSVTSVLNLPDEGKNTATK